MSASFFRRSHRSTLSSSFVIPVRTHATVGKKTIHPIGYTPWRPGDARRHMWPLYGLSLLPTIPSEYKVIATQFFGQGSSYLGNHTTLLMDSPEMEENSNYPTGGQEGKNKHHSLGKGNTKDKPLPSTGSTVTNNTRGRLKSLDMQSLWNQHKTVGTGGEKGSSIYPSTASRTQSSLSSPPIPPWIEIAVIGRSNVGKSSLLNTLLGGKYDTRFVPTSNKPGTTASLDFYSCGTNILPNPELVLVDTPGYGYSQQGLSSHSAWMQTISSYLYVRQPTHKLRRVLILIDSRTGLTALDKEVLRMLNQSSIPIQIILTKIDTLTDAELENCVYLLATEIGLTGSPKNGSKFLSVFPVIHGISAKTNEGVLDLQYTLVQAAKLATDTLSGQQLRKG